MYGFRNSIGMFDQRQSYSLEFIPLGYLFRSKEMFFEKLHFLLWSRCLSWGSGRDY